LYFSLLIKIKCLPLQPSHQVQSGVAARYKEAHFSKIERLKRILSCIEMWKFQMQRICMQLRSR